MNEKKFSWPPEDAEYPAWINNFSSFVDTHATVLGFTNEEVLWLKARALAATFTNKMIDAARKQLSDYVTLRNIQYLGDPKNAALALVKWIAPPDLVEAPAEVSPNAKATLDGMVKRVSNCNDITKEQKRSAGVLSRERTSINPNNATPILKVTVVNGQAVLDCPLKNLKGYLIYVEDDNAPAISLGYSLARKYTDNRPLPPGMQTQQRSYFIQYVGNKNKPVGNFSNKVTVAVIHIV